METENTNGNGPPPAPRRYGSNHLPRFPLGRILATPGAIMACAKAGANPMRFLSRHAAADWGDVRAEDRLANDRALEYGARLLSTYSLPTGQRVWIITEADRSTTTILLPVEY